MRRIMGCAGVRDEYHCGHDYHQRIAVVDGPQTIIVETSERAVGLSAEEARHIARALYAAARRFEAKEKGDG